ncbi:WAT1-related protein At3g18200-like [Tasmannia lanceolata]|uniref:WAT1-related protein At3g18200-like n=1 Tax=Tasmannia lanceolata TaxID=3420 RepID=UPI00406491C4
MKLHLAMLALQFCYAGFHIVSRTALNIGVSKVVFPVYRNTIALLLLGPFAYILEKKERPPLTFSLLVQLFLLALCGITANQGFYLLGLYYASPTFASAMQNSVPAITFAMAAALRFLGGFIFEGFLSLPLSHSLNCLLFFFLFFSFRLEQVNIMRRDGLAKVVGIIACVGGATIITLYKGPPLFHHQLDHPLGISVEGAMPFSSKKIESWTLGCIYLLGNCFAWSGWIVLQGPVLKKYPARLSVTSITCFFGLIQFLAIAAFVETDIDHWKIHSAEELLTILYAGVVASGIAFSLQIWCIDRGGPFSVAVFQPVSTLLVAIMAFLIFGDQLYSGAVIGAIVIMVGLYSVLWGKSNEKRIGNQEKEETLTKHLLDEENSQVDSAVVNDIP